MYHELASKPKDHVDGRTLPNVVIIERPSFFEVLSGADKSHLIGWDSGHVLKHLLHFLDGVGSFNIHGEGLPVEEFDVDLHFSWSRHKLEGRFWLDGVFCKSLSVFELLIVID